MKKLFLLLAAFCVAGSISAQVNPMSPIPADKEVRTGKLDNGMSYYIRHNEKPKGQADFHILHYVGAIQENDAQQGLAHFLEHMAFNGTKNLPGKQMLEYLETVGVKFGLNLNAATSWDYTTYMIRDVPTARQGVIDTAMLILHDWSHFIALEPAEIDSERGVIMEELRTRDGASWRSTMKLVEALNKGSKYEKRNLIGYLDGLKGFQHKELEEFYSTWYRPDYQVVVVVGDINVDAVEAQLKELMKDIPAPAADAPKKEAYPVPDNEEPIISIYTDPEMQGSDIQLFIKREAMPLEYNNLIYAELVDVLQSYMATMENARLQEIAMKPDAPFLGAGMNSGGVGINPTLEALQFSAMTEDSKLAEGWRAVLTEMEKMRRFGFTASEFERAQNDLMRRAERKYANRNDRRNAEFVNAYLSAFRMNTPIPDAQTEWQLDSMLIKSINVDAVNAVAQQLITPTNWVITVTAPQKEGVTVPTEEELLAISREVAAAELQAYEDNTVKTPLIADTDALKGSRVAKTATNEAYGTTEWTLKNGVKIIVKPTTFKADEVLLTASAKGGTSNLTDDELYMGEMMSTVNAMSGVGAFSATDLRKQLSGKSATVRTSAGNYTSSMSGVCSPKDLETMLQLLYLNFTAPRFDENDYNTLMKMLRSQVENLRQNPDYKMAEEFMRIAYGNNPRRQMISAETLDKFDFKALPAIYKKLFPNANSFTFTIVGNVDLDTLKPLVEKYIGSLPVDKQTMTFTDDHCDVVKGQVDHLFRTPMQQPKVSVHYLFSGDSELTVAERVTMSFLTQALNARYLVSIREEKGGTYGVQVGGSIEEYPKPGYELQIQFDTNEEMADELCDIIMKEIRTIAEEGPRTDDIEKHREFLLKNWKNSLEQNNSWMGYVNRMYTSGLDYMAEYEQAVRDLKYDDVKALAAKILANGNMVKLMMRPEAAKAE